MLGVELRIVYFDVDVVEVRVSAGNGVFGGQVELYAGYDSFGALAELLAGFPRAATETRVGELGTFEQDSAGGGLRLEFETLDALGHCMVTVTLRSDSGRGPGGESTARFPIPVEPAAIDIFVESLSEMKIELGACARLEG